jgi:hypothetical protein
VETFQIPKFRIGQKTVLNNNPEHHIHRKDSQKENTIVKEDRLVLHVEGAA